MNIHGQSKLPIVKQNQIEDFVRQNKIDILHLQEIEICDETFSACDLLSSSYNLLSNNSMNSYGTASLLRADLDYSNVKCDTSGRAIIFNIGDVTFGNLYAHSGTDNISRNNRENFFSETIPSLLMNTCSSGCIGGDLNSIIDKKDATNHQAAKMSKSFKALSSTFAWKDVYRTLHPSARQFSRYYGNTRGEGATRLDRCYFFGDISINYAAYELLAFSDHHAHVVHILLPNHFQRLISPEPDYCFRIKTEVVDDQIFQERLEEAMRGWQNIRNFGLNILTWWENIVKPGVKRLAQQRSREMNKKMKWELNLLRLRQKYLNRKLSLGETWRLTELKKVHIQIETWYRLESNKIKHQSQIAEHQDGENVRVYHHDLHRKKLKKTSILKLETAEGLLEGHAKCAEYLEKVVEDLLLKPAELHDVAQDALLDEVEVVFTNEDNLKLVAEPSEKEVFNTISESNVHAAPGTDGLTNYFYKKCFHLVGEALTEVVVSMFSGCKPTMSQRTSKMVFGNKPKKSKSLKPGDKRRISLLNCDFKTISGVFSRRFKETATRTLSPLQLVAGDDRRIHHGINLARDAIQASSKLKTGCGIADTDYEAAFDYLVMPWVFMVLQKKGVSMKVIHLLQNLYQDNISIIFVNNIAGKRVNNNRLSLRQGDLPSMFFFAYAIDPLITYLERRLTGILITSLPQHGPVEELNQSPILPALEQKYKVVSYADDLKPAIATMAEFKLVDEASALFEAASGCRLHRNPTSQKCKFLPLGKWRQSLQQEDLPNSCQYMVLSDHLDMVGVQLRATWVQTRKANGDKIQDRVSKTINSWRAGKFMPLTMRSRSINSFVLSKVWFRCSSIDLRVADVVAVNSSIKSWLYGDMFEKPAEMVMCRPLSYGGLGMLSVKYRAQAALIRSFIETAAHPQFRHSLLHKQMFQYHVLGETSLPNPGFLPYYPESFFKTIKHVHETSPLNVKTMTTADWTRVLTEDGLTMDQVDNDTVRQFLPCRSELASPLNNWQESWYHCRMRGLTSEMMTFNFKLLHNLLPVRERIHQLSPTTSPVCVMCDEATTETLEHALVSCSYNGGAGHVLLTTLQYTIPALSVDQLLLLQFPETNKQDELMMVFLTTATLLEIWSRRLKKEKITEYEIRTTLEAKCSLLRETRFVELHQSLQRVLYQI